MKRAKFLLSSAVALALAAGGTLWAQTPSGGAQQQAVAKTHLKVGDEAPDFTLNSTGGPPPVKLSDFRGKKNVVLAFYVLAFTGG